MDKKRSMKQFIAYLLTLCMVMPSLCLAGGSTVQAVETDAAQTVETGSEAAGAEAAAATPQSVSADDAAAAGAEAIMEELDALAAEMGAVETDDALDAETVPANQLKTGTNYEIIVKSTGMAMTVTGYSDANNAEICQMPANQYASQVWTLEGGADGYYQIVNKSSNKSLNVPWASKEKGVAIVQFNKENSDNSKWKIVDVGDGLCRIIPKLVPEFGLNIEGNSKNAGGRVIQWNYGGANNEKWEFREVSAVKDNPGLETPSAADVRKAVDAWIDTFYGEAQKNGRTVGYMTNTSGFWVDAEILEVLIDAYEKLGDEKYLTYAKRFYDGFIYGNGVNYNKNGHGTDWGKVNDSKNGNEYNDDVLWMSLATIRLYINTGDDQYYKVAKQNIEDMYNTQWDDKIGGGLWWKNRNRGNNPTKNTCVNGPGGLAVYLLAEAAESRGDKADADKYYQWGRNTADWLINVMMEKRDGQKDGRVQDNVTENYTYGGYISTGTQGNTLGVLTFAYKHTKDQWYLTEAKKVAKYTAEQMGDKPEGYLNREWQELDGCGGKGILGRWIGYFVDNTGVTDYNKWILVNAQAAWSNRNEQDLMWSRFGGATPADAKNSTVKLQDNKDFKDWAAWSCSAAVAWFLGCPGLLEQKPGGNPNVPDVPPDGATNWSVQSPNGKTVITFDLQNGSLYYTASQDGKTVVERSPMGIDTSVGNFTNGLAYKGVTEKEINETYDTFSGKKDKYTNHCKEKTITFTKGNVEFSIIARAYDDGVAFRYVINTGNNNELRIEPNKEITGIKLPNNSDIWEMSCVDDNGNITKSFMYEQNFNAVNTGSMANGEEPTMPMLYKSGDKYTLVTEAQKSGSYVGSHLKYEKNDRLLRFRFDNAQETAVVTKAPFQSPWRSFVIGGLDAIVNNTMVENLSPAMKTEYDFASWVEPGVSSWSWVANWGNGISDQANPDTHKRWIDLAADMGWKFYILDERWQPKGSNGNLYQGMYDWFPGVAQYAKDKGVKLIAWVNKSDVDTPQKRESRFKEWSEAGISGIKVDFFYNEKQSTLQLHEDIYAAAAKYRLLVNVHGSNPPSGEIRTYPNVIAREAIRGQETGGITANQYTILPFTRGAVGTADVTEEIRSKDSGKTTMGFQIALSTLFENGIHSLGSQPQDYYDVPAGVSYYKNFPARWDDLQYLDSQIGSYVNLARKAGDVWYAAGISVNARDMKWKPTFLNTGKKYTAIKYLEKDGQRQDLKMEIQKDVTRDTELSFHVQNGGGYAVKLVPQEGLDLGINAFPSEMKIQEFGEKEVTLLFTPADTTLTDVTWKSADKAIAQVSSTASGAVIKGLKAGKTTVTAESVYDASKKAEIKVEVTQGKYTLDTGKWEVINDNHKYKLNGENSISIQTENGVIDKNVFATKAPTGDFTIEGKISGDLNSNYQGGFIGAFVKGSLANNYVSVGRRYHTGFNTGGTYKNNHIGVMSGQNTEFYAKDDDKTKAVYVKLEKKGTVFTGYYSYDNKNWTQVKNGDKQNVNNGNVANNNNLYVGFYAGSGGSNAVTTVTFEDFKVNGNAVKFANTNAGVQETETYTVQFDSAGGTAVAPQLVQSGQKADKPADPAKGGAKFNGWYAGNQPYNFDTPVTKDILLTAKWTLDNLVKVSVEGESAVFENGAKLVATNDSSNGNYIGDVGGPANGSVSFKVIAESDGPRTMNIYYATLFDRKLNVAVNGKSTVVNCPGNGSWTKPGTQPAVVEITLKKGENTIQFSGVNGDYAPNIDRFELFLTEKEVQDLVTGLINTIPEVVTGSDADKALINGINQTYESLDKTVKEGINADKLKEALGKLDNPGTGAEDCLHKNTEKRNVKEATCKEPGYTGDSVCKDCGLVLAKGKEIPKTTTHKWDNGVITTPPTTGSKGEITFTCGVCGETKTRVIDELVDETGCQHKNIEQQGAKEATCKDAGYIGDTVCKDCGVTLVKGEEIPKTNAHKWNSGKIEDGKIVFTCQVCGVDEKHDIVIIDDECEHAKAETTGAVEATCNKDGYTGDWHCEDCDTTIMGKVIPATGNHQWDGGVVQKYATPEDDGEIIFTCKSCQTTYTIKYSYIPIEDGDNRADRAAANMVIALIADIGEVTSLESKDNIQVVKAAYDNLSEKQKKLVTNVALLDAAVAKLKSLEEEANKNNQGGNEKNPDKEAADKVVSAISDIIQNGITLDSEAKIQAAMDAYNALTPEQKKLVGDYYSALTAAQKTLEELKAAGNQNAAVNVTKIKIKGYKKIAAGKKATLEAEVSPKNATNASVTWSSNNKKYATVTKKGVVKTKKAGKGKKVTITATANDGSGVKATYKISIMPSAVKKVKIEAKSKTVKAGKNLKLKAVVTPNSSSKKVNKTVEWSSSNEEYATVKKGVVKTKKAGKGKKVTITAKATDGSGKKAKIKISIQ